MLTKNPEKISAISALTVSCLFAFLSFYHTGTENYLFPRIIAVVLGLLAIMLFLLNLRPGDGANQNPARSSYLAKVWPGLLIGLIYFLVMEYWGFYFSSFLAFLAILICYGQSAVGNIKVLAIKFGVASVFIIVLFVLFWHTLHVRTPTGWFF